MLLHRISYLLLLIIAFCFCVLYVDTLSYYLLLLLLLLPLAFLAIAVWAKKQISVTLLPPNGFAFRGEEFPLQIRVKNSTLLPVATVIVNLVFFSPLSGKTESLQIRCTAPAKNAVIRTLKFTPKHCGVLQIRVKKIRITDLLRLFLLRPAGTPDNHTIEIVALPQILAIPAALNTNLITGMDSNNYSAHAAGNDSSEIFGLHEYRDGDKMSRVHWKITAKTSKLYIKDYSLPLSRSFLILCDASSSDSTLRDANFAAAASVCSLLINAEESAALGWYDTAQHTGCVAYLDHLADFPNAIAQLSRCLPYAPPDLMLQNLPIEITRSGTLYAHCMIATDQPDSLLEALTELAPLARRITVLVTNPAVDLEAIRLPVHPEIHLQAFSEQMPTNTMIL